MTTTPPRKRDPEGRRRMIIAAAAEHVLEHGPGSLTHRAAATRAGVPLGSTTQHFSSIDDLREAALQSLVDETDVEMQQMAERLDSPEAIATELPALLHEALSDRREVRAGVAMYSAALADPGLEALAVRWTERLTEMLERHVGRERAVALEVVINGATLHAALREAPLSREAIARITDAILAMPTAKDPS
ncbi:TetR/AcrR family transcriptional regulator [Barrientosiimonas humi]|uniref:TetR/AcrR family transcriptional regulator n=1 Tax=Barrientosiimonas humi TaxID=999931 RepID=UPI00370DC11D